MNVCQNAACRSGNPESIARGLCSTCYARDRRRRQSPLQTHPDGPCAGHPCDDCRACARGRCCRGDNPDYSLPLVGSITPFYGNLGQVNSDGQKIECHICGGWYMNLNPHLQWNHDVTVAEYKAAFGLAHQQPLLGEQLSAERRRWARQRGIGLDAEGMAAIRPTPEQQSAFSTRPERLQVRTKKNPWRVEMARTVLKNAPRRPHVPNVMKCPVCDRRVPMWMSAVRAGRRTCGRRECARAWRLTHHRTPTNAKLTNEIAAVIRRRALNGEPQSALADEFGISQTNVSLIKRNKIWREA